ncbi:tyrosine-type recombinase/integrase [Azospirillum doebereinerae]|uniref:tyrosine-type recombinase/integrase n=1 Tax=Azospirillum doebereinerae TaxID=92933 RepID=UPI001EE5443C|nr:site-specific integrase [Azospirillum doebereinerae]MCG5240847.1 tyrosine-type recombinase/integrase [Azospirillum doebereinerae]
MPSKITKRLVDATKPGEKDLFVWDTEVKGFGLKVTPAGGKIYILQYRIEGGRTTAPKRFTIGKHGSPWTADQARDEAIRLLGQVKEKKDPQALKAAERDAAKNAQSFADIADLFIEKYAKPKNRSWAQSKGILDRHVIPTWGKRPIQDITRSDVRTLLNKLVDGSTPIVANRTLATVRKAFNWAMEQDYVQANPCSRMKLPAPEQDRDRVLSDAEVRDIWLAADKIGHPYGPFVQLLILTAQRREEVAGMRWSELDLDAKLWTIPRERAKNKKAHEVPLSDTAVKILKFMPRFEVAEGQLSDFVCTLSGKAPISGFSKAKALLDAMALQVRMKAAAEQNEDLAQVKAPEDWRFHDVRRTVTTGLARIGVAPQVADKILNHVSGTIRGVAATYNRFEYIDERRAALDAWARKVDQLVQGMPDNVVELRPAVA